jgi:hypothetical protein
MKQIVAKRIAARRYILKSREVNKLTRKDTMIPIANAVVSV